MGRKMKETGIKAVVLEEIKRIAQKYQMERVILFGSRARGDYVKFSLDVDEYTSTLLQYDIVDLDGPVVDELRWSIEREGIVLYEKI